MDLIVNVIIRYILSMLKFVWLGVLLLLLLTGRKSNFQLLSWNRIAPSSFAEEGRLFWNYWIKGWGVGSENFRTEARDTPIFACPELQQKLAWGRGSEVDFHFWTVSIWTKLEDNVSYQELFSEWKHIVPNRSYCIFKSRKYTIK